MRRAARASRRVRCTWQSGVGFLQASVEEGVPYYKFIANLAVRPSDPQQLAEGVLSLKKGMYDLEDVEEVGKEAYLAS